MFIARKGASLDSVSYTHLDVYKRQREHIDGDLARTTFNEYNQACRNQSYFDCAVAIEKL